MGTQHYVIGQDITKALAVGKRAWPYLHGVMFESKEALYEATKNYLKSTSKNSDPWSNEEIIALVNDLWSLGLPLKVLGDYDGPSLYSTQALIEPSGIRFSDVGDPGDYLSAHLFGHKQSSFW